MMNGGDFLAIILMILLFVLGLILGHEAGEKSMQRQAIEHGCAGYGRTTGEFQFNMEKLGGEK